jgi:hypothetical protein
MKCGTLVAELDCYALPAKGDVAMVEGRPYKVEHRAFHDLTVPQQVVMIDVSAL